MWRFSELTPERVLTSPVLTDSHRVNNRKLREKRELDNH